MGNTRTRSPRSIEGGNSLGFRPIDDNTALETYVAPPAARRATSIVVVSHLGLDEDEGLTVVAGRRSERGAAAQRRRSDPRRPPPHRHQPAEAHPDDKAPDCTTHDSDGARPLRRVREVRRPARPRRPRRREQRRSRQAQPHHLVRVRRTSRVDSTGQPTIPTIANLMWPYSVKINQDIDLNGVFAYVNTAGGAKIVRNDLVGR